MSEYEALGMALTAMREKARRVPANEREERREWDVAIEEIENMQREYLK